MIIRKQFPQVYELEHQKNGRYWLVSARQKRWGLDERKTFTTKQLAMKHAQTIGEHLVTFGGQYELPKEKIHLATSYEKLMDRLSTHGKTPEDAVTHFLNHLGNEIINQAKPFIQDLADKWREFKNADTTLSKKTLIEIRSYARFIKSEWGDLKPDGLKKNDIDLLLKKLKVSNNTRRKYLRYIRMFFSWIKDEGIISKNPTDGIFFKPDDFNGDFYSPETTRKLLRYVIEHEKDLIGYYALLTFAGLRPSEGARVEWRDYNFKTSQLYVRKGKTLARYITLEPVAVEWIRFHRDNTPHDSPFIKLKALPNREKLIRRAVLNGEWIQDGLRHGFGTYFKALTKSIERVSDYMGNSPVIVKRHYARTIPNDQCETFWNLTPQNVLKDNQDAQDASGSDCRAELHPITEKTSFQSPHFN